MLALLLLLAAVQLESLGLSQELIDVTMRGHQKLRLRGGFSGDIELRTEGHSLAHIVENARGPLHIACRGQRCYSWPDAAAIASADMVEVVGIGGLETKMYPILAGQWFLMDRSNGRFCKVNMVHRCLVDRQHLELRVDMLIIGGQGRWEIQECNLWTWWGGVITCMDSAALVITDTLISGAGEGDMRSHCGVTAFDRARVGLRRCLIQQIAAIGERSWNKSLPRATCVVLARSRESARARDVSKLPAVSDPTPHAHTHSHTHTHARTRIHTGTQSHRGTRVSHSQPGRCPSVSPPSPPLYHAGQVCAFTTIPRAQVLLFVFSS